MLCSCRLTCATKQCRVHVNPGQLTAALINLLANARDAMEAKGEVVLRVESFFNRGGDPRWPGLSEGRLVSISVVDRGRGMSGDVARQATMPFFTTKGSSGGTGLGLSTVHGFAAQSGGVLRVDSTRGVGTTMSIVLPQCAVAAA
jgi:signal transduction histidine kinase